MRAILALGSCPAVRRRCRGEALRVPGETVGPTQTVPGFPIDGPDVTVYPWCMVPQCNTPTVVDAPPATRLRLPGQELGTDAIVLPQSASRRTRRTDLRVAVRRPDDRPAGAVVRQHAARPGRIGRRPAVVVMPLCEWVQSQQWGDPPAAPPSTTTGRTSPRSPP